MNKSAIFTAAHKRAKALNSNFGTYAQRFSIGLKIEYRAARNLKTKQAKKELAEANKGRLEAIRLEYAAGKLSEQPVSCYLSPLSWEYELIRKLSA